MRRAPTPPRPNLLARALDAFVLTISPARGVQRLASRARASALLSYDAARRDRVRSQPRAGSADSDLLPDLAVLREKSRSLVRDDAHAAAAARVWVENVVGCGINPQACARPEETGLSQEDCDAWNEAVEQLWFEWAAGPCDANRYSDWAALTRAVERSRFTDGEALVHRVVRDGVSCWELIDVDRLQDPAQVGTVNTRHGVELGAYGDAVAYWILPQHPDDVMFLRRAVRLQPDRYLRDLGGWPNILHVFRRDRAGLSRGVPVITPAMPLFEHLHHYLDSEVIAARANANIAAIVRRPLDKADPAISALVGDLGPNSDGTAEVQYLEHIEPGTFQYLNEGEELQAFTPNRPGSAFDPFVMRILRAICGAIGLPYELVVKDFGAMNYSSARVSLLEARRGFETEQQLLIDTWCRPCWETRVREAVVNGELPTFPQMADPAIGMQPFLEARWIRGAWGWVDPTKEIDAARLAVESNLSTPQAEAARAGLDVEEILEARARFLVKAREIEERNDLEPGELTRGAAQPAPASQTQQQQQPEPQDSGDSEPDAADPAEGDEEDTGE